MMKKQSYLRFLSLVEILNFNFQRKNINLFSDWAGRPAVRKQKMTRVGRSDILDKYEMMGVVGEGSYGTVHRARNRENGISVAIKKFIEDDSNTLKIAQREVTFRKQSLRTVSIF